jgi:hypothetical protein
VYFLAKFFFLFFHAKINDYFYFILKPESLPKRLAESTEGQFFLQNFCLWYRYSPKTAGDGISGKLKN